MSKIYADFANNLFLETGYFLQQQPTTNNQQPTFCLLQSIKCQMWSIHYMKKCPKAKPQVGEIEVIRDGEIKSEAHACIKSLSLWTLIFWHIKC